MYNTTENNLTTYDSDYKSLRYLLDNNSFNTPKQCPYTNITDQRSGCTYALPCFSGDIKNDNKIIYKNDIDIIDNKYCIDTFFDFLEKCRVKNLILNYCEKQFFKINKNNLLNTPSDISMNKSCIEYDFDIYIKENTPFPHNFYDSILNCVFKVISNIIDFNSCDIKYKHNNQYDDSLLNYIHVCILNKPQREIKTSNTYIFNKYGKCYKESFHLRIFIKVTKEVKIFIRKKLLEMNEFISIFLENKNILNDIDNIFDGNSPSFPAMFLGSMKKNGDKPHTLYQLYKITFRNNNFYGLEKENYEHIEVIENKDKKIKKKNYKKPIINMCYDLSLNFENPNGKIKKAEFNVKQQYQSMIINYVERNNNSGIKSIDMKMLQLELDTLINEDKDAGYIIKILDILKLERVTDFNEWRKIIFILASANIKYKCIAIYFSIRSGDQFEKGGLKIIEDIFNTCHLIKINNVSQDKIEDEFKDLFNQSQLTIKSLYYWAKQDNIDQYNRIRLNSYNNVLMKYLNEAQNFLKELHVADILKTILHTKYITLKKTISKKGNNLTDSYIWYEFIDDPTTFKSIYKWKACEANTGLAEYLKTKFIDILKGVAQIKKKELEKLNNSKTEDVDTDAINMKTEYIKGHLKILNATIDKCGSLHYLESVIKASKLSFLKNNITEDDVDNYKDYIGVKNGVLQLYPTLELIDSYHNILITKSTNARYIPYDKNNKYIKDLEKVFIEIFDNDIETYSYVMMLLASGLDDREKNPQKLFIMHGVGSQGKSVISEFYQAVMGNTNDKVCPGYTAKINTEWLCSSRSSSGPDATVASLKGARTIFCSEIESGAKFNAAKVKELLSEQISFNAKFKDQDTMKSNANIISTNNFDPEITDVDYGMRRRLEYLRLKMTFYEENNKDYNPNNPRHGIVNKDIMNIWKHDINYQNAFLSILVKFYIQFRDVYNYDFSKIPHSIVKQETEEFFERQDPISKFIKNKMIYVGSTYPMTGKAVEPIAIKNIYEVYKNWYSDEYGELRGHKTDHCAKIMQNYKIYDKITKNKENGETIVYVTGYVIINEDKNYDQEYNKIFNIKHIVNYNKNSNNSTPVNEVITNINICIDNQSVKLKELENKILELENQKNKIYTSQFELFNKKRELEYTTDSDSDDFI